MAMIVIDFKLGLSKELEKLACEILVLLRKKLEKGLPSLSSIEDRPKKPNNG